MRTAEQLAEDIARYMGQNTVPGDKPTEKHRHCHSKRFCKAYADGRQKDARWRRRHLAGG